MKIFQRGFNYSQDGQGNRLVYHLQGCNMRCPWCSNPEGISLSGEMMIDPDWMFEDLCPYGAIRGKILDRKRCHECDARECITVHKSKGITLSCTEMSVDEIAGEASRSSMMFYDGGGVTLTGGEATVQYEEMLLLLKKLKQAGIHTAMETNGTHKDLAEAFPFIDQLIMDCKLCSRDRHKELTGADNLQILENLNLAARQHPHLHIRVPLIGGVNNRKEDIREFLELFQSFGKEGITFEVLSYHEYGREKWKRCGKPYVMTREAYVRPKEVDSFRSKIVSLGLHYQST